MSLFYFLGGCSSRDRHPINSSSVSSPKSTPGYKNLSNHIKFVDKTKENASLLIIIVVTYTVTTLKFYELGSTSRQYFLVLSKNLFIL